MGDFNLDLLRYEEHAVTQEFIDSLFSYMFIPIITRPTRLTAHTATLIDNIFTNCLTQNITNGIIINDISDHLPIFASFNNEKIPYTKTNTRGYNDTNFNNFQSCLSQVNDDDYDDDDKLYLKSHASLVNSC